MTNQWTRRGPSPASVGEDPGVYPGQRRRQRLLSNPSQASRVKRRVHEDERGSVHGDSVSEVVGEEQANAKQFEHGEGCGAHMRRIMAPRGTHSLTGIRSLRTI